MDVIRLRTLALMGAFVLLVSLGCDPGDDNNITDIPPGNNGQSDGGDVDDDMDVEDLDAQDAGDTEDPDASDSTDETDGDTDDADGGDTDGGDLACQSDDECAAGEICLDEACVTETPESKCEAATDLGTLDVGSTVTGSGDLFAASDMTANACSSKENPGEVMFRFKAGDDGLVRFDATYDGAFGATVEYRGYNCGNIEDVDVSCYDSEETFFATGGTEYLVIVELDSPRGGNFSIDLSLEAGCQTGDQACDGGDLKFCTGDGFDIYGCAGGCATATCMGDSCANPIQVTGSASFNGDLAGYSDNYNFEDSAEFCSTGAGTPIPTPGQELVFELPNLSQGQTIVVDTESNDNNANAIFIANNCGEPFACAEASLLDENLEWTAPSDGTYYVIIDKQFGGGETFNYGIEFK